MEENIKEKVEDFKEYLKKIDPTKLMNFEGVSKFKSIGRAIKRGHVSPSGLIYPRRPFNNRSNRNNTRKFNEVKKTVYGKLKKEGV